MEDKSQLTLHASRRYALIVFLGCMIFVAAGIWMLTIGEDAFTAWGCIVFFGGGSLLFVRTAFDSRPLVVIDDRGILDRTLAVGYIPWNEIMEVQLDSVYGVDLICLQLHRPEELLSGSSRGRKILLAANRAAGFGDICISMSGLSASSSEVLERIHHHITVESRS